jgi:hypothetical protein
MYFGSVKRRQLVIASGGAKVATCGHIACPDGRVAFTERNDVCHYLEAGKGGTVAPHASPTRSCGALAGPSRRSPGTAVSSVPSWSAAQVRPSVIREVDQ